MNKVSLAIRLASVAALGTLSLAIPTSGAVAAQLSLSPFGKAVCVADSALAQMRGGFDNVPFGLSIDAQSWAEGRDSNGVNFSPYHGSYHVDNNGGTWHTTDTGWSGPHDLGPGTTITNWQEANSIVSVVQNSQPGISLTTLQQINVNLTGNISGLINDIKSVANQAALQQLLHNH